MNWTSIAINIGILLYILTILAIIYTIILENRNPVRTLAWILVLVLVPGIGLFFYIYFGMNYRKIKMFSMKGLGDFKWLQYMSEDQKQRIKKAELLKKEDMEAVKPLMTLLLNNSKALLSRNNTIEILNNGEATFGSIFKAIAKAKKYIHLEYYIIDKGELGEKLKELLITKAKEGVEVRVVEITQTLHQRDEGRRDSDLPVSSRAFPLVHEQGELPKPPKNCCRGRGHRVHWRVELRRPLPARITRHRHLARHSLKSERGSSHLITSGFPV